MVSLEANVLCSICLDNVKPVARISDLDEFADIRLVSVKDWAAENTEKVNNLLGARFTTDSLTFEPQVWKGLQPSIDKAKGLLAASTFFNWGNLCFRALPLRLPLNIQELF